MIKGIDIKNAATYGDSVVSIKDLKKINFFFGANGTGKTTVSRIIANPNDAKYPDCRVKWENGTLLKTLVYNQDFVRDNFNPQENLKGIFTLGKEEGDVQAKIGDVEEGIKDISENLNTLKADLSDKKDKKFRLGSDLREKIWKNIKEKYGEHFPGIFEGYRKGKDKLRDRLIDEYDGAAGIKQESRAAYNFEHLKTRTEIIFAKNAEKLSEIEALEQSDINKLEELTNNPILQKKIVAKEDIAFGKLIKRLGNSDWVNEGLEKYIHEAGDPCPFCQQNISEALFKELQDCFDEEYKKNMKSLGGLHNNYDSLYEDIMNNLQKARNAPESFIDETEFSNLRLEIKGLLDRNKDKIRNKIEEASLSLSLEPVFGLLQKAVKFFEKINVKIRQHNKLIDNKKIEEKKLVDDIWAFFVVETYDDIAAYKKGNGKINTEIEVIENNIARKTNEKNAKESDLKELRKKLVSVEPTVDTINAMLKHFGFTNFELNTSGAKKQFYKLRRLDGSEAQETLSEGERSFITFLYFYHLIKGSHSVDDNKKAEVIVFDDPVSSLDSNILFIVSELIRALIRENKLEKESPAQGHIKQIFILTHNVYFHKQVSNELKGSICFYCVYKIENHTSIECKGIKNTVTNSYECLWSELKFLKTNTNGSSAILIQNVMRRILEYYFEDLQGKKKETLAKNFSEEEQRTHVAFLQWLHAGSHEVPDENYYRSDVNIDNFLPCFEMLFEKNGQGEHYQKMINRA